MKMHFFISQQHTMIISQDMLMNIISIYRTHNDLLINEDTIKPLCIC